MPSFTYDELYELCRDEEYLKEWLLDFHLVGNYSGLCFACNSGNFYLRKDSSFTSDNYYWRCSKKSCGKKLSFRNNSWFAKSHLSVKSI